MFDVYATHSRSINELLEAILPRPTRDSHPHHVTPLGEADRQAVIGAGREVEDHVDRTFRQLQSDLRSNHEGSFVRVRMSLAPEWLPAFRHLEAAPALRRIVEAAERVASRELPRHQGVMVVRTIGARADPVVDLYLSPRLCDGGAAPLLRRADLTSLEARWDISKCGHGAHSRHDSDRSCPTRIAR